MLQLQLFVQAATPRTRIARRSETHPNREGAPAYYRTLREQVSQILLTGTLGNTFYASGRELGEEAMDVLLQAREECPEFLAKALVYARKFGCVKTLPTLGLAVLSGGRGKTRPHFEAAFDQVVLIPDDLRAFVALCLSGKVPGRNGLGGVAREAVRKWIAGISEYHALKYGSAASREVTLRDILRLAHPHPRSANVAERFGWLVKGSEGLGDDESLNPQIRRLEALKQAQNDDEIVRLIHEGHLPFEVVLPSVKAAQPAVWEALLYNAPYMNLLRNLVAFTRHGVFAKKDNVWYAVERLTDQRAVERSKVLPFRFFDAWRAYSEKCDAPDNQIADAIRKALELSFSNMPTLGNRQVAIGTDVSGSMCGPISDKGSTRCIDIAGIFTGALMRRIEGRAIPLPFSTQAHANCGLSGRDEILTTAEKVARIGGGGTAIGAPVEYLLQRKLAVDVFIGITDQEDWAYGEGMSCSGRFFNLWRRYRQEVAPSARAFLVTIAPYRDAVAPAGEKGIRFIYGWSGSVLKYIALDLESGESQMKAIEQMRLKSEAESTEQESGDSDEDAQTA
ncbi:TROVE domain-containing protein [Candidatus Falkowbacteria bacterium]|nr:TROVE domain-containing protein [Candidatus Falkowbacteria bacterium]